MANVDLNPCAYCGLAVPTSWWGRSAPEPAYCCYGCRFAANVSAAGGEKPGAHHLFTRFGLAIFCTMNVMAFTMALWSIDIYDGDISDGEKRLFGVFRYVSMLFAFPVYYTLGIPLLENAWDSLRRGVPNLDAMLVVGVSASYLVSVNSVLRDQGPIYFEVGCMVLVLVTLGRWLEATGKARASEALNALEKTLPERVRVVDCDGEKEKSLRDVTIGDRLRVLAGERIPCDGILDNGPAHIDEQLLSGESAIRTRETGERLFAGTINLDGIVHLTVAAEPDRSALARLVRMIRSAQANKGRFEQFADRVSRWFLPAVIAISIGATIYHSLTQDGMTGMLTGLSVVLIACPCALGIATPLATWAAIHRAARNRVLIHGGDILERLARVNHLCFDKTGTLTTGSPRVGRVVVGTGDAEHLRWAANLAGASSHVFSRAIAAFLAEQGILPDSSVQVTTLSGRGVRGDQQSEPPIVLGSERWIRELGCAIPDNLRDTLLSAHAEKNAIVCFAMHGSVQAVFVMTEDWRPEMEDTLGTLQTIGMGITVLSGDPNLQRMPFQLEYHGNLLPEEKHRFLEDLRRNGKTVAMVGDGINDGPSLAASDVGIALGAGADVARDTAGVCLLDNDLRKIPWCIELAKQTVRIMKQNLAWAFAFNIIGITWACVGKLNPVLAALAMTLSSLLVLANSMRGEWATAQSDVPSPSPEMGSNASSTAALAAPVEAPP